MLQTNDLLLTFLRAALLNQNPDIPVSVSIDWEELRVQASEQGLLAIVWDGICKLPQDRQPSRFQKISYELSAQEVHKRYGQQKSVLLEMISRCQQNGMKLLLLKGIGLSELYPNPETRPSGDIDVFFPGEYKQGNELFAKDNYHFGGKHSEFVYHGVTVENHVTMVNTITRRQRKVEQYLEESVTCATCTPDGYYMLPPMEGLVYLLVHTLGHLKSTYLVSYRNIVDFFMYINRYKDEISPNHCNEVMKRFHLNKSFELLLYLSEWVMNVSLSEYHLNNIPSQDVEKVKQMICCKDSRPEISPSLPYFKQFVMRQRYNAHTRWMNKYLPKTWFDRFKASFYVECSSLCKSIFRVLDDKVIGIQKGAKH